MKWFLLATLTGCAAPLQGTALPTVNCTVLDSQHRSWGAIAKFSGALAGTGGLATLPISEDQKAFRLSVALTAVVLGGVSAAAVYVQEDAAGTWSRLCAK